MKVPAFLPISRELDGVLALFEHRAEAEVDLRPTTFLLCVNFQSQSNAVYSYEGQPSWHGVRQAGMAHLIEPARRITGFVPTPTDHVVLELETDWLSRLAEESLCQDRAELITDGLPYRDDTLRRLAELIRNELVGERNPLMLDALATAAGLQLLRSGAPGPRPTKSSPALSARKLAVAKDYLRAYSTEGVRLRDVAAQVGLSPDHFWRCFKQETGRTPQEYQTMSRVDQVIELLADPVVSLAEASAIAGFSSQSHMTRAFKKHVGVTPARWRRDQR